jgi:hypothetical protein
MLPRAPRVPLSQRKLARSAQAQHDIAAGEQPSSGGRSGASQGPIGVAPAQWQPDATLPELP